MQAGQTLALVRAHCAHHLPDLAEPSVRIANAGYLDCVGNVAGLARHFVHAQQADVWVASRAVGQPGSGNVHGLKPSALGQHGHGRVKAPGKVRVFSAIRRRKTCGLDSADVGLSSMAQARGMVASRSGPTEIRETGARLSSATRST